MITPLQVLLVAEGDVSPYRRALQQGGYDPEITQASSLDDLDDALEDEDWDVVIVDAETSSVSEVVRMIDAEQPGLPIIAIGQPENAPHVEGPAMNLSTEDVQNLAANVVRVLRDSKPAAPHSEPMPFSPEAQTDISNGAETNSGGMPALAEHLPIGLYQSTPDGRVLYANPALVELLGCDSADDLYDLNLEDLGYPREQFLDQMRRFGFVQGMIVKWTDGEGKTRYARENTQTVRDTDGRVLYYEGTIEDVTEARLREEHDTQALSRNLAQHKALAELAGLPGYDFTAFVRRATELAARHSDCERVLVAMADEAEACVRTRDVFTLRNADHAPEISQPLSAYTVIFDLLNTSRCIVIDDVASDSRIDRFGARTYMESNEIGAMVVAPIRRQGRAIGLIGFQHVGGPRVWSASDVDFASAVGDQLALACERDEQQRDKEALSESEARYRAVSELSAGYALAIHVHPDGHHQTAWASEAFEKVTGYTAQEIDALDGMLSIVLPEYLDAAEAAFAALMKEGEMSAEFPIITKWGDVKWLSSRAMLSEEPDSDRAVIYCCGQDITERKRFEDELVDARENAEEMARMKGAYLANMSHDIRAPLTGILGYAELLTDEADGEVREIAKHIERSGRRLLDTLNSVLNLARIDGDSVELDLEAVDVAAEAEQVVELLKPLAEEKGITLLLSAGDEPVHARVDKTCLGRILTNLIGNGIKFTEEGEVEVTVRTDGDAVRLAIRDTGIGIDPQFLPHLFDEFRQESTRATGEHEGTGLGLSISKRLVEMLGGTIEVESQRPGGTTFSVILQLADEKEGVTSSGDSASAEQFFEPVVIHISEEDDIPTTATDEDESNKSDSNDASEGPVEDLDDLTDLVEADHEVEWEEKKDAVEIEEMDAEIEETVGVEEMEIEAEDVLEIEKPEGELEGAVEMEETAEEVEGALEMEETEVADAREMDEEVDGEVDSEEMEIAELVDDSEPNTFTVPRFEYDDLASYPPHNEEDAEADAALFTNGKSEGESAADDVEAAEPADESELASLTFPWSESDDRASFAAHDEEEVDADIAPFTNGESVAESAAGYEEAASGQSESADSDLNEPAIYNAEPEASEDFGSTDEEAWPLAMHGDSLPDIVAAEEDPIQAEPPAATPEPVHDERTAVLVVEDNPDTRMLLERILKRSYNVQAVGDARSALALMNENHFDGFVLDINLGGKETGVDILRIARTLPGYKNVFAIAVTAYALPGDRERFLQAGFNKYVPKPFTRSTLLAALSDGLPVAA